MCICRCMGMDKNSIVICVSHKLISQECISQILSITNVFINKLEWNKEGLKKVCYLRNVNFCSFRMLTVLSVFI